MLGGGNELGRRAVFDDASSLHDRDRVALPELSSDREVVGDEQDRELTLLAKTAQHLQHADAQRDVQHRQCLVGDERNRLYRERACNGHPLALSARQLVRVFARERLRWSETDVGQEPGHPLPRGAPGETEVAGERCRQRLGDGHAGVERGVRVLVDQLDSQPMGAQLLAPHIAGCASGIPDLA